MRTQQVEVVASVVHVDEILATVVLLTVDHRVSFSSGYVHGYSLLPDSPKFAKEACVLHALGVVREWTRGADQGLLHYINIQAGDAFTVHQIQDWISRGVCKLQSHAAS